MRVRNIQLMQNALDWSVEDLDLLSIRARGARSRLLDPMSPGAQRVWEAVNYGSALAALGAVALLWQLRRRRERPMLLDPVEAEESA